MPEPASESDYFARVSGAVASPRSPGRGGPPGPGGPLVGPKVYPPAGAPESEARPYAQPPAGTTGHDKITYDIQMEDETPPAPKVPIETEAPTTPTSPTAHSATKSLSLEEPEAFHTSVEATNAALLLIADALHRQVQHYYQVALSLPSLPFVDFRSLLNRTTTARWLRSGTLETTLAR